MEATTGQILDIRHVHNDSGSRRFANECYEFVPDSLALVPFPNLIVLERQNENFVLTRAVNVPKLFDIHLRPLLRSGIPGLIKTVIRLDPQDKLLCALANYNLRHGAVPHDGLNVSNRV